MQKKISLLIVYTILLTTLSAFVIAFVPITSADQTIDIYTIPGVTVPKTGETPVSVITETEQYTGTVTWNPIDNPFVGKTQYTATIILTAKSGFTFTGVAANFFTVDGATNVANLADSGVVTAVFPATGTTNQPPFFGSPSPSDNSINNPLSFTWNIPINDLEGNTFTWTIQCSNKQVNSGTGASNGTKSLALSGLAYSTPYTVWVNATDPTGSGLYTRQWYRFTTQAAVLNTPPVFGVPSPTNGSTGNLLSLTWSIPINDPEGNSINWAIKCSNGQTNSGTNNNGTRSLTLSSLTYSKTYTVWVNATDPTGSNQWTRRWYTFTTLGGSYSLTLTKSGTGNGTIQASPAGPYNSGTVVTIWANASVGSTFSGFSGNLTGMGTPQTLVINGNKVVGAQFTLNSFSLTLTKNGTGDGTIQTSPSGPYSSGAVVTIWANASFGSTFSGFSGNLTGKVTPQTLVMNGNRAVAAQFTLISYSLTIRISGTGTGTIQASPSGPYYSGADVWIWANASTGSYFAGFSGVLTGTTTPQDFFMYSNKTVNATFTLKGGGGTPPPSGNQKPIADLSAGEPYHGVVNTAITFNGSNSTDSYGTITKWSWDFGDNTSGIGEIINHSYSKTGSYKVTLTVTDNKGATNTDTSICLVSKPDNRPPTTPFITGPTKGTKNTIYTYTAVSTDADNDSIQYAFDWGDSLSFNQLSEFLPNETTYTANHSWSAAGRYTVTVNVTDNQTISSSKITVYIDAVQAGNIGYLMDTNGDHVYDAFYSDATKKITSVQALKGSYNIDSDGDGVWDYTFGTTNELGLYQEPPPNIGLIFILGAILIISIWAILVVLWMRKTRKLN